MGEYFVVFDGIWKVLNLWKVWFLKNKQKTKNKILQLVVGPYGRARGERERGRGMLPRARGRRPAHAWPAPNARLGRLAWPESAAGVLWA